MGKMPRGQCDNCYWVQDFDNLWGITTQECTCPNKSHYNNSKSCGIVNFHGDCEFYCHWFKYVLKKIGRWIFRK
jgi:hypothetical protein